MGINTLIEDKFSFGIQFKDEERCRFHFKEQRD